jgi:hypothetical protein
MIYYDHGSTNHINSDVTGTSTHLELSASSVTSVLSRNDVTIYITRWIFRIIFLDFCTSPSVKNTNNNKASVEHYISGTGSAPNFGLKEQDRLCTCNVILWHFRVTIVAVEIQQCILCTLLSYTSLSTIQQYWVLHNNALWKIYVSSNNKT